MKKEGAKNKSSTINQEVKVHLFSGTNSHYLGEEIAENYGKELGTLNIKRFSDGEIHPEIQESIRGSYVFFIQSTFAPAENLMELLLLLDAAKRASAAYICAIIPYFGYARQDRKDMPRVPISAKLMANLLQAAGATRVMTMDLHADQIQGFFDIPVDHLKAEYLYFKHLRGRYGENISNMVFAAPDVGGVKRARIYAKEFKSRLVICDKHRERANQVAGMTVIGDVKGADVILVDDLVDTAGTLCTAADVLIQNGAKSVRAICTHPILSGKAYENIENSKLEELLICDTIPLKRSSPKIEVIHTAELFAKAIMHTHDNLSISQLFVSE